jgi:hypothetical protein
MTKEPDARAFGQDLMHGENPNFQAGGAEGE